MGVHLHQEVIERILEVAEREMAGFVFQERVVFDAPGHVISGRKPVA